MELSNTTMHMYLDNLQSAMHCTGILGYAVARNTRMLRNTCQEYLQAYEHALDKYGTKEKVETDNGYTETLSIKPDSREFTAFISEVEPLSQIKHSVDIFKVSYKDAIEQLTAEQMLQLEWMLTDEQEEQCKG